LFSFLGYAYEVVICLFVPFEGFPISKIQTPPPSLTLSVITHGKRAMWLYHR
jgi:hypothetical protein